jgi:L-aminopeptidase/D-esterase-like protein
MALQITSFTPIEENMLAPTPNVSETEYFSEILKKDETPRITDVEGVHLKVLTSHRGTVLYCAGGVTVFRVNPGTFCGNGYYAMPSPGTEETVHFSTPNGRFRGQAIFLE